MTVSETIRQLICLAYDRNADADITFGEALRFYGAMCAAEASLREEQKNELEEEEDEERPVDETDSALPDADPAPEEAAEEPEPDASLTAEKMAAAILNASSGRESPQHYVEFKRETYARLRAFKDKERINAWPLIIEQDSYFKPEMLRAMYNNEGKFQINVWRRLAAVLDVLCPTEAEGSEEA